MKKPAGRRIRLCSVSSNPWPPLVVLLVLGFGIFLTVGLLTARNYTTNERARADQSDIGIYNDVISGVVQIDSPTYSPPVTTGELKFEKFSTYGNWAPRGCRDNWGGNRMSENINFPSSLAPNNDATFCFRIENATNKTLNFVSFNDQFKNVTDATDDKSHFQGCIKQNGNDNNYDFYNLPMLAGDVLFCKLGLGGGLIEGDPVTEDSSSSLTMNISDSLESITRQSASSINSEPLSPPPPGELEVQKLSVYGGRSPQSCLQNWEAWQSSVIMAKNITYPFFLNPSNTHATFCYKVKNNTDKVLSPFLIDDQFKSVESSFDDKNHFEGCRKAGANANVPSLPTLNPGDEYYCKLGLGSGFDESVQVINSKVTVIMKDSQNNQYSNIDTSSINSGSVQGAAFANVERKVDGRVYYTENSVVHFLSVTDSCGENIGSINVNGALVSECSVSKPHYRLVDQPSGDRIYTLNVPSDSNFVCDSWMVVQSSDPSVILSYGLCSGPNSNRAVFDIPNQDVTLWWKVTPADIGEGFDCKQNSKRIDVSLCPGYSQYANNSDMNSGEFFNNVVLARAAKNSENQVIILIPADTFYFKGEATDPNSKFNLDGFGQNFPHRNYLIEGMVKSNKKTTFRPGDNLPKNWLFYFGLNRDIRLMNINFDARGPGESATTQIGQMVSGYVMLGNVEIENISCYGDKKHKNACLVYAWDKNSQSTHPQPHITIRGSRFENYYSGVVITDAGRLTIENNIWDNYNADGTIGCLSHQGDRCGNVGLAINILNRSGQNGRSRVYSNVFRQNPGVGSKTDGETHIGIIGLVNGLDIINNDLSGGRDAAMHISSHKPGGFQKPPECVYGGPKNVVISGNSMRNINIGGIEIVNSPVVDVPPPMNDEFPCYNSSMDNITVSNNTIVNARSGIKIKGAGQEHGPINNLTILNNRISDSIVSVPNSHGVYDAAIEIKGVESNNKNNVKVYGNTVSNAGLAIYLAAHWWPSMNYTTLPTTAYQPLSVYLADNYPVSGVHVYSNTIHAYDHNQADILYQINPVRGVLNENNVVFSDNIIDSAGRCNFSCENDSDCLQSVPVLEHSKIVPGYAESYVCVDTLNGGVCRNAAVPEDSDCDLNGNIDFDGIELGQPGEPDVDPVSGGGVLTPPPLPVDDTPPNDGDSGGIIIPNLEELLKRLLN